jgi:hypothetical protein
MVNRQPTKTKVKPRKTRTEPEAPAYVAPEAKVKLPDGSEATVDDLIKGNLRDRDYRQKTQALATERETSRPRLLKSSSRKATGGRPGLDGPTHAVDHAAEA